MHQRGPRRALAYRVLCDFSLCQRRYLRSGYKTMSNTAYSKPRRVPRDFYKETPGEDEPYEEYEEEYEEEEPEESVGLFSTPARTVALVTSLVVLLFVAAAGAWLLGQKVKGTGSSGGLTQIATPNPSKAAPKVGALAPDFELTDVRSNKPL